MISSLSHTRHSIAMLIIFSGLNRQSCTVDPLHCLWSQHRFPLFLTRRRTRRLSYKTVYWWNMRALLLGRFRIRMLDWGEVILTFFCGSFVPSGQCCVNNLQPNASTAFYSHLNSSFEIIVPYISLFFSVSLPGAFSNK